MDRKLHIGIIGCGGIANGKHMPSLKKIDTVEMVAFCDIVRERAEKAAKEYGTPDARVYTDYKELLKEDDIDVVHVLTPNKQHSFITVDALEAGKHVMCEKPMAINSAEAKKMLDAAKRTGKKLTIGYQSRFRQDSMYLKKVCENGELGDIYYARAQAIRRRAVPTWGVFLDAENQGGGPLIDIGTHALDLTLWEMNNYEPAMVTGSTFRKLADHENSANAWGPWDPKKFTVFQSYALFPHMNVFQNIAYGLKVKGVKKAEQKERVEEALRLVRLSGYEKRMPSQLSGGQRQRIAIARAAVLRPKVLLLDEPLGALDLKLRQQMQTELKRMQQEMGITFVYITHDQEEALNMSTRIVILREGRVEQIGTPEEVYEHPQTLFAAGFIGQSNLLRGEVTSVRPEGRLTLRVEDGELPAIADRPFAVGDRAVLCLRPQRVRYGFQPQHQMELQGVIRQKYYSGGMQHTLIALSDRLTVNAVTQASEMDQFQIGDRVYVGWNQTHAPVVPDEKLDLEAAEGGKG